MDQCNKLIYILGIDALDYKLVEKLSLNNLMQIEYNKIIVPINEKYGVPSSPEVWASFLIGENMPMTFVRSSHYINVMRKILNLFQIDINNRFIIKANDLLKKHGFISPARFGDLNRESFLDIIKSYEINAPYYSFDNKTFVVMHHFGNDKLSLVQSIKEIKLIYENRKRQIISEIKNIGNIDTVFAFMHTTDSLQHLSHLNISEIKKHYIDLDNYVSILKRKLEDTFKNIIFIIVSDHGFDFTIVDHSNYAFYSSNTPLIPRPKKITDFYRIILDIVDKKANSNIQL